MSTSSINFKTDSTTKKEFNNVAQKLGLSSALLNLFVTQVAREQAVPFEVKVVPRKDDDLSYDK